MKQTNIKNSRHDTLYMKVYLDEVSQLQRRRLRLDSSSYDNVLDLLSLKIKIETNTLQKQHPHSLPYYLYILYIHRQKRTLPQIFPSRLKRLNSNKTFFSLCVPKRRFFQPSVLTSSVGSSAPFSLSSSSTLVGTSCIVLLNFWFTLQASGQLTVSYKTLCVCRQNFRLHPESNRSFC